MTPEFNKEYELLMHAIQTGIAVAMGRDDKFVSPKHLRVGLDGSLCSHGALVALLIEKGVFTEEEYGEKLLEYLRKEKKSWENKLGQNVTLG